MSFRINRVYTRSGDKGETSLVGGARVSKADERVKAVGDVDEVNAVLGLIKEKLSAATKQVAPLIEELQQELFDVGAEIATPPTDEYPGMWKAAPADVQKLEKLCDQYNEGLPELKSFILPGGSEVAALFHLARTVARRAERSLVDLIEREALKGEQLTLQYLNRLSDLLFVLARWSLKVEGLEAPLWVKAAERK